VKRRAKFYIALTGSMLTVMLSLLIFCLARVSDGSDASKRIENDSFRPSLWKPGWVDQDNNRIADSLDQEIAARLSNHTAQEYTNVAVMIKSEPTVYDADAFVSSGGYLATSPWTHAIYGFGGRISYNGIGVFANQCPDVLLVEKEAICQSSLAYAATQVGARTYVWSTLGLQGDPNSSVAIIDTGIDASHPDFSPGFGDQNFSKKIIGWNDQVGTTTSPYDDNGHGSQCSGLSAGNGFFSVDASGNATATCGANLGSVSSTGTYFISGMMVNKTGTITIKVKWATTGTAKLSALPLYYGDKTLSASSWTQIASVSTPSQNTWYALTYNVAATPSGGYDMYHVLMTLTAGTGNLYVVFTMSWPYAPPSDGFSAWTGIAPQSKLVGVKVLDYSGSGTSTGLINGIDWIIANRMTYHITVASMSLGFTSEVTSVDSAVVNLVNSGVATIVAAGNNGSGTNYIYTPSSVDEVITVAATNQFDNIVSYSSQGGASRYKGKTVKPDITAPGGSFYAVPLFSADSNYNDADGEWPDVQANDSAPMQGTSMAAPVIAGAADIVIQAMEGYTKWNWTRSQALQPKMILLMTATETYPNLREPSNSAYSPTLERGGKDVHEGYGRLNLDAAVEALLKTYQIGTTTTDTLGTPPTLSDVSVLGQKLAWARNVQLVSGFKYNFTLNVPTAADCDLYLYNSTGTAYGEPSIVASSTTATTGGTEQFTVTAPYNGTYYIVVKRATETTGSGMFSLKSSGPALVELNTTSLSNASNVLHYTQNGASKNGSIASSIFSDYADTGTTLEIENPIYASTTQRYTTSDSTSFVIQWSTNFTVRYTEQFWIQVDSSHDSPSPSQWGDQGSTLTVSVTSPADDNGLGTRYRCTGWTGTGSPPASGTGTSTTFTITEPSSITWNWITQYPVTFGQTGVGIDFTGTVVTIDSVSYDRSGASFWWDNGSTHSFSFQSPLVVATNVKRYVWDTTAGLSTRQSDSSFNTSGSGSMTGDYLTQWYTTFDETGVGIDFTGTIIVLDGSNYNVSLLPTSYWYLDGSSHTFAYQSPLVVTVDAKRYTWNTTSGLSTIQADTITVADSATVIGNYKTQYNITFAQENVGSDFTGTVLTVDGANYGASALSAQFWWENGTSHVFSFSSPLVVNATRSYDWISTTGLSTLQGETLLITGSGSVTGNYFVHIRYVMTFNQTGVDVDFAGTVVTIDSVDYSVGGLPVSFLWDAGSSHTLSFNSPLSAGLAKQYLWISTSGLSPLQSGPITAKASGNIIGNYKRKPTLTMNPTDMICRKYNETFFVQINVTFAGDMNDFRFEIHYNATLLDVVNVSWTTWGDGTCTVDEVNGILSGYTSGSPINGNVTLLTVTFNATYHHIWKDESTVSGWKNIQTGTIYFQRTNLTYPSGQGLDYERGGLNQIDVGPDFACTFSPIQGDIDNNGTVDIFDLKTVAAYYDQQNTTYNLTADSTIDIFDLVAIGANYGYEYSP
jgi:subtilisin family serine protease